MEALAEKDRVTAGMPLHGELSRAGEGQAPFDLACLQIEDMKAGEPLAGASLAEGDAFAVWAEAGAQIDVFGQFDGSAVFQIVGEECTEPIGRAADEKQSRYIGSQVKRSKRARRNGDGGLFTAAMGGFRYDRATNQFVQDVDVTNRSGSNVAGPIALMVAGLSPNATLATPVVDIGICPQTLLALNQTVRVTLRFNNPTRTAIRYTPQTIAGLGRR